MSIANPIGYPTGDPIRPRIPRPVPSRPLTTYSSIGSHLGRPRASAASAATRWSAMDGGEQR